MASYFVKNDLNFTADEPPIAIPMTYPSNLIVQCFGAGDIRIQYSTNGDIPAEYGDNIRIKAGKDFHIGVKDVTHIKIFYTGTDSGYQVYCE